MEALGWQHVRNHGQWADAHIQVLRGEMSVQRGGRAFLCLKLEPNALLGRARAPQHPQHSLSQPCACLYSPETKRMQLTCLGR